MEKNNFKSYRRIGIKPEPLGPWERYMEDKAERIPSIEELKQRFRNALEEGKRKDDYMNALGTIALASVLYITGARISEVVKPRRHIRRKHTNQDGTEKVYDYNYEPEAFQIKDLYLSPPDEELKPGEQQYMRFRIKVRKSRDEILFREASIKYGEGSDTDIYHFFLEMIEKYFEEFAIDTERDAEKILFNTGVDKARKSLVKYLGYSPHTYRDLRASHLMSYSHFTSAELQRFFAWKNANMPLRYAQANFSDCEVKL